MSFQTPASPCISRRTRFLTPALALALSVLAGGFGLSAGRAAAQSLCLSEGQWTLCFGNTGTPPAPVQPPVEGTAPQPGPYDQNIMITTHNNTRERIVQTFTPNVAAAHVTRICLHNRTRGERAMTHGFSGINPLRPAAGASSCANFPANTRVAVELVAAGRPARADRTMVWSTTALAGGRLDLVWGG